MGCVSIAAKRVILRPNAQTQRAREKEVRVSRDIVGVVDSGAIRAGGAPTQGLRV